jgi:hypothetical protein
MKRFAIVAAIAAIAAVGCKSKEEKKDEPAAVEPAAKPTEPAATEPAATEPAATDTAAGEDMSTGIPECDDLVKRYTACDKMPAESKTAFLEGAKAWKQGAAAGDETVKQTIADSCKQAAEAADAAFKASGC